MKVTCRQIEEWLLEFVSGELPADICQHIQVHLEYCRPCVTLIETYQVTINIGRKLQPRPVPDRLQQRLSELLQQLSPE
jgi:hypothetical protein